MEKKGFTNKNLPSSKNSHNISRDINSSVINKESANYTKILESNNEFANEFAELKGLWNELGVTETFKNYFENVAMELDTNIRREYVYFEVNNLKKLKEQLQV